MPEANINLLADAEVAISGTIADPTLANFEAAGRTYTVVGGVMEVGEFGDEAQIVETELVSGARVRKAKGTRNAGDMELIVARDSLDAGQIALRAAQTERHAYAVRITMNDAPAGGTPTVHYLKAFVASARNQNGGPNDVVKTVFTLAIDAAPLTVEAEAA